MVKASLFKGGAVTSAVFTFAVWLAEYRWIFTGLTFVFLGIAFYKTYKDRHNAGKWNFRML